MVGRKHALGHPLLLHYLGNIGTISLLHFYMITGCEDGELLYFAQNYIQIRTHCMYILCLCTVHILYSHTICNSMNYLLLLGNMITYKHVIM